MTKHECRMNVELGSAGAPPAASRASRDTPRELFGEGAEKSGRGARAPQVRHS